MNGNVTWDVFVWIAGAIGTGMIVMASYIISNDAKRECDKDSICEKLDKIQDGVSEIKCIVAANGTQIKVNTHRLDKLEEEI